MRKRRFTEHQIVDALRRAERGVPVKDICRALEVSSATFYTWRSTFVGMDASDRQTLREAMPQMAERHSRRGGRKLCVRLCRDGHSCNHKRVWRVDNALGLTL